MKAAVGQRLSLCGPQLKDRHTKANPSRIIVSNSKLAPRPPVVLFCQAMKVPARRLSAIKRHTCIKVIDGTSTCSGQMETDEWKSRNSMLIS
jgi:hypothetical protein